MNIINQDIDDLIFFKTSDASAIRQDTAPTSPPTPVSPTPVSPTASPSVSGGIGSVSAEIGMYNNSYQITNLDELYMFIDLEE